MSPPTLISTQVIKVTRCLNCFKATRGFLNTQLFFVKGYRVYNVDGNYKGSSRFVLDHETYILNLTEANHSPETGKPVKDPKWGLLYRAREAYQLPSLFPADLDALLQAFVKDDRFFQKFWYFKHKGHVSEPCKDACKTTEICLLRSGLQEDLGKCSHHQGLVETLRRATRKIAC